MRGNALTRRAALLPLPDPTRLRRLTSADAVECARLHASAFARGWSRTEFEALAGDPAVWGHVAARADEDMLAAFVMSRLAADEAEILSIVTDATSRRQGHARRLLPLHLETLNRQGVRSVFLEVDEGNRAARALYDASGFRGVGRRDGYYGGGVSAAIVMRLDMN